MNVHVATAFDWSLPAKYEWIVAREVDDDSKIGGKEEAVLVPRDGQTDEEINVLRRYQPLENETGLFLQVASLSPIQEAILKFAARFGPLTRDRVWVPKGVNVPARKSLPKLRPAGSYFDSPLGHLGASLAWEYLQAHGAVLGDSLSRWTKLIERLRHLVAVWQALRESKDGDFPTTGFELNKRRGKDHLCLRGPSGQILLGEDLDSAPTKSKTRSHAERLLLLVLSGYLQGRFHFGLEVKRDAPLGRFAVRPTSLEDGVWLQFTLAVLGNKVFRECEACGTPFEVSLDAFRTNRTLCSTACKTRAYRMRRTEALALADKGKTARQIAKTTGAQISTVEKWLKERN